MENNTIVLSIESYLAFVRTQVQGDSIPNALLQVLLYDDIETARKLPPKEYEAVLNLTADYAKYLYSLNEQEVKPYARHFILALVKELTRLKSDINVIRILAVIKKEDYDGWEMCLTHCSREMRDSHLKAERIMFFINDAIRGTICGAIIGAIYVAVRMWLKI